MSSISNGESGLSVRAKLNTALGYLDQGVATTDSPSFAGLRVDSSTLYVDSANNRVGIGTTLPASKLQVEGDLRVNGETKVNGNLRFFGADTVIYNDTGGQNVDIRVNNERSATQTSLRLSARGANDFIRAATNDTERLRIDSSGNVLIGTSTTGASILRVVGLPTSSAGLSSGDVWNDSGTLKIV